MTFTEIKLLSEFLGRGVFQGVPCEHGDYAFIDLNELIQEDYPELDFSTSILALWVHEGELRHKYVDVQESVEMEFNFIFKTHYVRWE